LIESALVRCTELERLAPVWMRRHNPSASKDQSELERRIYAIDVHSYQTPDSLIGLLRPILQRSKAVSAICGGESNAKSHIYPSHRLAPRTRPAATPPCDADRGKVSRRGDRLPRKTTSFFSTPTAIPAADQPTILLVLSCFNFQLFQRAPSTMRFHFGAKVTSIALASIEPTAHVPMSTLLPASSRSTVVVPATLD
jgi:hypothetical protein